MGFKVFNTLSRGIEEFAPLESGRVRLYTCGPTVYDYAHLGNFRAYVFEDLLRRYLKYSGFQVVQVMNLTDVDDKTIRGSRKAGVPLRDFTQTFKTAFLGDLAALNIERADVYPAATDHIPEMIDLTQRLLDKGCAYRSDDGSIYFSISRCPDYGRLAHLDMSGLRAGARVLHDEYEKENVADFALWKAWDEEDGDVAWDSPWGRGRPGWHIECSAMSMKYLGESFDLHTGGVDYMFPHHENEIAQSESATGKPFVKYWMHCAHLIVEGRKMSKSLGNFYTLRDLVSRGYSGREIRYVLVGAHYRQALNFTFDALDAARASLARLDEFRERLKEFRAREPDRSPARASAPLPGWAAAAAKGFTDSLDEDLSISGALSAFFDMVREGNKAMDAGALLPGEAAAVLDLTDRFDRVFGFLQGSETSAGGEVMALVEERERARKAKDWAGADKLRQAVLSRGWIIQDAPDGAKLRRK